MNLRNSRAKWFSATAIGIFALVGCTPAPGAPGATAGGEPSTVAARPVAALNQEASALVPKNIADAGVLKVASTIGMAPLGYPDPKTGKLIGFNVDIMDQIGEVLGLKIEMHEVSMDQIIPGIQAGRYDATASNMAVTDERLAVLDFVQYYFASSSLAVASGNPDSVTAEGLCGKSVGVSTGSFQQTKIMPEKSKACADSGAAPIDLQAFPDQQKAVLALDSGRVDAVAGDTPILLYAANLNKKIEVGDKLTSGSILGIGVSKKSPVSESLAAAMNDLITTGVYQKTLDMYGIGKLGIEKSEIKR